MAEDEETAPARYIASNVSTQLMLKTLQTTDSFRSVIRGQHWSAVAACGGCKQRPVKPR